ncbi:hypothetical protein FUAX_26380 [Fulvitalea axinellae]|uniref:Porin n=1 Tax=Fulvitalea axinellae TaxID=1182444 RepID=A0AAU9CDL6_9BACT|nr:hypothetical protein FUAX_26380 [Fulvitalea axinellae]
MDRYFKTLTVVAILFGAITGTFAQGNLRRDDTPDRTGGGRKSILDDSSKLVYNPNTLVFTKLADVKYDLGTTYSVDTTLSKFYKWDTRSGSDYTIQNLGNVGTAAKEVFFTPPKIIGKTSGFSVYDYYFKSADKVKFYNTKSPYTSLYWALGSNSRSVLDVSFSRNITPLWNIGADFSFNDVDKAVARSTRNDTETRTTQFDIYTWYKAKSGRYELLANFTTFSNEVRETGGVLIPTNGVFSYDDARLVLNDTDAEAKDKRTNVHLFHQYNLLNGLGVYHEADWLSTSNRYEAFENDASKAKYPILMGKDTTSERSTFTSLTNEMGVKGHWRKWYYQAFFKNRVLSFSQKFVSGTEDDIENSVGGYMRLDIDSTNRISLRGELLLTGDHRFSGKYEGDWFDVSYVREQYAAPYIYDRYTTNHQDWSESFNSQQVDQIKGRAKFDWRGWFHFYPGITLTNFANYLYFVNVTPADEQVSVDPTQEDGRPKYKSLRPVQIQPRQTSGVAQVLSPEAEFEATFGNFGFKGKAVYSIVTGGSSDVFPMPDLFVNAGVYWENKVIMNKIGLRLGVDVHWASEYYAYGYDPTSQQFYLQQESGTSNSISVEGFTNVDLYMNIKMKYFRLFLKYRDATLAQDQVNFVTPYYVVAEPGLDFGISWFFFD